ncbi:SDR family oxidoreductase [bacterium]|nr:SDR family oxidoreductase [bacterium]
MNILITGTSKGIGNAIANELADMGRIFAVGRNKEKLKTFENYCVCDLSKDLTELKNFIKQNKIDVLINNAGEYIYGSLETLEQQDIKRIYQTNLIAPAELSSFAIPFMKENKWGRIINIGSISGVMGEAYASVYSSSKAGLTGLTKALALELAEFNITVNTINPGWVETELGMNSIEESEFSKEEIIDCIPQKRFVKPEEVAKLCRYLISEDAKGITGQSINLCAGLSVGI